MSVLLQPSAVFAMTLALLLPRLAAAEPGDPRLRELAYDPQAVVTVPVKRGVVTLVVLDAEEAIIELAAGLGGDCSKPEAAWCVAAQPGGRTIFIKPKSTAAEPNNLAIVTDKRTHSFRFVVLPDGDPKPPVYRLTVKAPVVRIARPAPPLAPAPLAPRAPEIELPPPAELLAERLKAQPQVLNASYALAEGEASEDIVPSLVFDDGRFTYLRFPGNREIPAVFHVLENGSETLVNTRMEDDLLVVDRVSRHLMLRAGQAVVGIWNEAFDIDGVPPALGTTVPGVERRLKPSGAARHSTASTP